MKLREILPKFFSAENKYMRIENVPKINSLKTLTRSRYVENIPQIFVKNSVMSRKMLAEEYCVSNYKNFSQTLRIQYKYDNNQFSIMLVKFWLEKVLQALAIHSVRKRLITRTVSNLRSS